MQWGVGASTGSGPWILLSACHLRHLRNDSWLERGGDFSPPCVYLFNQKACVSLECWLHVVCKNCLCQCLSKLYAFLVKAVYIPDKALEHYLVLVVGKECAQSFRCYLFAVDEARRSAALKELVGVVAVFSAREGYNLCGNTSSMAFTRFV